MLGSGGDKYAVYNTDGNNHTAYNTDAESHMSYDYLEMLRKNNPAWRLLASQQAHFAATFFYREFVVANRRQIPEQELISRLDSFIDDLNEGRDEPLFARSGREYLNDWADDQHGWLRRFFPSGQDEPHFDITSHTQKAVDWLLSLKPQAFIGTESRLLTVFELLRQIVAGAEADPKQRISELQRQKAEIEREITRVANGEIDLFTDTQIKERFWQAMTLAREILSDFRAVEHNFRELDRALRERIAVWDKGKGELLDTIFSERDGISDSEQGKSFSAFWKFLMSSVSQEDFAVTLERVLRMKPVRETGTDFNSRGIHHDWVQAGAHVQETVAGLSQQLRQYVDDNYIEEERRINQILREIEGRALAVRNIPPTAAEWSLEIDAVRPEINLTLDRPLYTPREKPEIKDDAVGAGAEDFSVEALYSQISVDKEKLKGQIAYLLQTQDNIDLSRIIARYPLELGLSELIMYLVIAGESADARFHTDDLEEISWVEGDGKAMLAKVPKITFGRPRTAAAGRRVD